MYFDVVIHFRQKFVQKLIILIIKDKLTTDTWSNKLHIGSFFFMTDHPFLPFIFVSVQSLPKVLSPFLRIGDF